MSSDSCSLNGSLQDIEQESEFWEINLSDEKRLSEHIDPTFSKTLAADGACVENRGLCRKAQSHESTTFPSASKKPRSLSNSSLFSKLKNHFKKSKNNVDSDVIKSLISAGPAFGLIMNDRPQTLPPKSEKELKHHMKLSGEVYEAARKQQKETIQRKVAERVKCIKREEKVSDSIAIWKNTIIPQWNELRNTNRVRKLWSMGLPPCVRSVVWKMATPNELQLTRLFVDILLRDAEKGIALYDQGLLEESPVDEDIKTVYQLRQVIKLVDLDVNRTYANLKIFQTVFCARRL